MYTNTGTPLAISSGNLVLDGQGNPNAVFIFQMASTFTMTSGLQVFLVNGANANNIFWQVGSSATLGSNTVLYGNILATTSITLVTGATVEGRALAYNGAVTIDTGAGNSDTIPPPPAGQFVPVTPCRVIDTRSNATGGPFVAGQTIRSFVIPGVTCNIPTTALTYSLNIAVVPHGVFAYLTAWPTGQTQPETSTLNSDGRVKSSGAIVPAGAGGAISVFVSQDTDVVIDINGYFAPVGTVNALSYYPVTPCRVSDTRTTNGPFRRTLRHGANVPDNSGSFQSVRHTRGRSGVFYESGRGASGTAGYLTAWATGQAQPNVASLNASTNQTTTSNAAIVPAGTGGLSMSLRRMTLIW